MRFRYHYQMKKHMTEEDAKDLIQKVMPEISDDIVKLCFCYSKMTIIDEMKDMDKYDKLEFVEFLEFIGRIASVLPPLDSKKKLYPRIERVVQKVLTLVNEKIKYNSKDQEIYSESDSEAYKH